MEYPIRSSEDADNFRNVMHKTGFPYLIKIIKGENRTAAQNKTLHKWFGEIAAHLKDQTFAEVKADCNLTYGRPIKMRDDAEWAAVFGYLFDALNRPAKLKAIRVLDVPFTRDMTVAQLTEYMNQMLKDYTEQGVMLTVPEDRK